MDSKAIPLKEGKDLAEPLIPRNFPLAFPQTKGEAWERSSRSEIKTWQTVNWPWTFSYNYTTQYPILIWEAYRYEKNENRQN